MSFQRIIMDGGVIVLIAKLMDFAFLIDEKSVLSNDEFSACTRIPFWHLRQRVLIHRILRRHIIAGIVQCLAAELFFIFGTYGKPKLCSSINTLGLEFNCSHSDHYFAIALNQHHAIGIDIEEIRSELNMINAASLVFTSDERAHLASLHGLPQMNYFLQRWTRKEAIAKAMGLGLNFNFSALDANHDVVKRLLPQVELHDLASDEPYSAALARIAF